jgi:hypothetical protein
MSIRLTKRTLRYVERACGYTEMLRLAEKYGRFEMVDSVLAKIGRMKPAQRCSIGGTRNQARHAADWA